MSTTPKHMDRFKSEGAAVAAAAPLKSALSWQAAHPFFKATRRGAQIHAAHLAHLHHTARIALANVSNTEARATLADIVEDAGRVLALCKEAEQ
jgi:hypothetical protein